MSREDGSPSPENFGDIKDAAKQDAKGVAKSGSAGSAGELDPALTGGIEQQYATELHSNMQVARRMRWWAFGVVGVMVVCFLVLFLCASSLLFILIFSAPFITLFEPTYISLLASIGTKGLIFLGLIFALMVTVPLSLAMALVKMIDEKHQHNERSVKAPAAELGSIIAEMVRAIVQAVRRDGSSKA